MTFLKRFGWMGFTLILAPFIVNRANSDFDKAPFSALSVIVLFLLCFAQAIAYSKVKKRCTELEQGAHAVEASNLAITLALNRNGRPVDKENHYGLVKAFAHIDADGNYHAQYERHGTNEGKTAINHIRILTCADCYMDFPELQVEAVDLSHNQARLKVALVEDEPNQKLFDIYFKKPVQPRESFAVAYSFHWRGVMRGSGDYDFFVLKDLERGVDKLCYELEFERELPSFCFEKLNRDGEWEPLPQGAEEVRGNFYSYSLALDNPTCDAYRFSYKG